MKPGDWVRVGIVLLIPVGVFLFVLVGKERPQSTSKMETRVSAEVTGAVAPAGAPEPETTPIAPSVEGPTIAGRVVNEKNEPVSDAAVSLNGDKRTSIKSDPRGYFQFTGLREGKYELRVTHTMYSSENVLDVPTGKTDLEIKLEDTGSVEGQVIDSRSRNPISEFTISSRWDFNWLQSPILIQDSEGRFTLTHVSKGRRSFTITAPGYAEALAFVEVQPKQVSEVQVSLTRGAVVTGHVQNANGEPVVKASILPAAPPLGSMPNFMDSITDPGERVTIPSTVAETDTNGNFEFTSMPGFLTIWATHPDYAPAGVELQAASDQTVNAQIVLRPAGTIRVRVLVGEKGDRFAKVSGSGLSSIDPIRFRRASDDGVFEAKGVPSGPIKVTVSASNRGRARMQQVQNVMVEEGMDKELEFNLFEGTASLRGHLDVSAQQPQSSSVSVDYNDSDSSMHLTATVNYDGTFEIDGLDPGIVNVKGTVSGVGGKQYGQTKVELLPNKETEVEIHLSDGATVVGSVSGLSEGFAAQVFLVTEEVSLPESPTMEDLYFILNDTKSSTFDVTIVRENSGEFTFKKVPPGNYTVVAMAMPENTTDKPSLDRILKEGQATLTQVRVDESIETRVDVTFQ